MANVGDVNDRGQEVLGNTGLPSTSHGNQRIWRVQCNQCGNVYGANGCDLHIRKCPKCQRGKPSEPLGT